MKNANEIKLITQEFKRNETQRFYLRIERLSNKIVETIERKASKGATAYITRIRDKRMITRVLKNFADNGYSVSRLYCNFIKISW